MKCVGYTSLSVEPYLVKYVLTFFTLHNIPYIYIVPIEYIYIYIVYTYSGKYVDMYLNVVIVRPLFIGVCERPDFINSLSYFRLFRM